MIRHKTVTHEFVESVPAEREEGVIYVSIPFATAVHNCLCGCGMKVVTPIKPHKWALTFDGETIGLDPSVGNWSFPCQSHYFIRRGRVIAAGPMDKEEVAAVRARDESLRRQHYKAPPQPPAETMLTPVAPPETRSQSFWGWLKSLFR